MKSFVYLASAVLIASSSAIRVLLPTFNEPLFQPTVPTCNYDAAGQQTRRSAGSICHVPNPDPLCTEGEGENGTSCPSPV